MTLDLYDKVKLKTGETAHIVEIYEQGVAYEADVEVETGEYETETIKHDEILYVFAESNKKAAV